tara:strand:- start:5138 stop:5392 length:255 start_codon:yes stop_codon:yes gene_type:complete
MSYRENYDDIEWGNTEIPKKKKKRYKSYQVMSDIQEFVSPIDRSVIGSRSQLRAHESRHGVKQIGNDWAGKAQTNSAKPENWGQ